jgi:hypothetical protein
MDALRTELRKLLKGGQAFEPFDAAIAEFDASEHGVVPKGAEHSPWQIVEHLQFSLRDILDFCQNADGSYMEKEWPDDYWPTNAIPRPGQWETSVRLYREGIQECERFLDDPGRDLFAPFAWGDGQTLLHEILLVADHAAYHVGELVELKRWIAAM